MLTTNIGTGHVDNKQLGQFMLITNIGTIVFITDAIYCSMQFLDVCNIK